MAQLVGIKTNIGGYFFDAYLKVNHNKTLKVTEHPVEEGANIKCKFQFEPIAWRGAVRRWRTFSAGVAPIAKRR